MAREELENICELLPDDKNTLEIALAVAGGETRAKIINRFRLTDTHYDTAPLAARFAAGRFVDPGWLRRTLAFWGRAPEGDCRGR